MKTHVLPTLLLCVLAGAAGASPTVFEFDDSDFDVKIYNAATNHVGSSAPNAFDKDETTGVGVPDPGYSIVADFSGFVSTDKPKVYISEIEVVHTGVSKFSLYTSEDNETWIPVPDAQGVKQAGSSWFKPRTRALYVKYVFDTRIGADLLELYIRGWKSSEPKPVSRYAIASFHNANGTIETADFGGGDNYGANAGKRLFDNNFTTYWPQPRAQVGSFIMVDFTKNDGESASTLKEYYVSKILVGSNGTMPFTLQYSDTGTNDWTNVPGAVNVKHEGTGAFEVGANAKYVRYVFNGVNWGYAMSQGYLAEIQVLGMDPDDVPCTHPGFTEWTVSTPASCTERALLSRACNDCGEVFKMYSDQLPLGHDYVTSLVRSGKFKHPGTGRITCTRCNFALDFPEPIDLATSRVDNVLICGRKTEGIVRFVDYDVSSENHPEWGPAALNLFNGVWFSNQGYPYWFSLGKDDQYVDFTFGTEIDLSAVEFSVYNHGYLFEFFSLDEDSGVETLFCRQEVVEDGSSSNYQRIKVPIYETTVKTLRIRITDYKPHVNEGWGPAGIRVLELHPWGTIRGAGELRYRKETLMILR